MRTSLAKSSLPIDRTAAWDKRLLISIVLFILLCTLFPFQFSWNGEWSILVLIDRLENRFALGDVFANIILFLPVGFSLKGLLSQPRYQMNRRLHPLLLTLIFAMAFSTTVESLQLFLPVRSPNGVDVMANSLGGLLGYGVRQILPTSWIYQVSAVLNRPNSLSIRQLLALFLGYLTLVVTLVLALPSATSLTSWDTELPLILGNEKTGDRPWHGSIAELYMSDRAFSPQEAQQALNQPVQDSLLVEYNLTSGQSSGQYQDATGNLPDLIWQGTPTAMTPQGVALSDQHWLMTIAPATRLTEQLRHTSQFTLITAIATADFDQTGPARIISQSQDPFHRNFTLGQQSRDLHIRLRTWATDSNGTRPHFVVPNFFKDRQSHRLVITYGGAKLTVYQDQAVNSFEMPTDFVRGKPEYFILYHGLIFVPLGLLLAMILKKQILKKQRHGWWIVFILGGVVLPSLMLEGVLAMEGARDVRVSNGVLGMMFTGVTILVYRFGLPARR